MGLPLRILFRFQRTVVAWGKCEWAPPIMGAILVPACGLLVMSVLGPQLAGATFNPRLDLSLWQDLRGRASAVAAITSLLAAMCGLIVLSLCIVSQHVRPCSARWNKRTLEVALGVFIITLLFSYADAFVGLTIAWDAVERLPSRIQPASMIFHFLNACGGMTTVFVVSAVAATLYSIRTTVQVGDADRLRVSIDNARHLLFATAAVLVIATLELLAVYYWLSMSVAESSRTESMSLGLTIAAMVGTFYSVFLFGVFGPVMLLQCAATERIALVARPLSDYAGRRDWIEQQGLRPANLEAIGKAGAVLAPLLTGTVLPLVVTKLLSFAAV